MNTVLGIEFIKFFDEATQDVAAEGPRLLHLDGHGSHISLGFLVYAQDHDITVLSLDIHHTAHTSSRALMLSSLVHSSMHIHYMPLTFMRQHSMKQTRQSS